MIISNVLMLDPLMGHHHMLGVVHFIGWEDKVKKMIRFNYRTWWCWVIPWSMPLFNCCCQLQQVLCYFWGRVAWMRRIITTIIGTLWRLKIVPTMNTWIRWWTFTMTKGYSVTCPCKLNQGALSCGSPLQPPDFIGTCKSWRSQTPTFRFVTPSTFASF